MSNENIRDQYNRFSNERSKWLGRNWYFYKEKEKLYRFLVPEGKSVLVIGCEDGDLLASLKPSHGVGIDISNKIIDIARARHPEYKFYAMDAQEELPNERFDYVIAFGVLGELEDVQKFFNTIKTAGDEFTCYIIDHYNALWEPFLMLGEAVRVKMPAPYQNWLQTGQINNLLRLCGFEVVRTHAQFLFPFYIPLLSYVFNSLAINIPFLDRLSLLRYIVAKKERGKFHDYGASVVIPCKNEEGNIQGAIRRIPQMGKHLEIIFVDNGSTDNTLTEIKQAIERNPEKDIKLYVEPAPGKKNAIFKGFGNAEQEVLMTLDADLTTAPEDLIKFFDVVAAGKAEFVNGSRMVYPQEKESMRYLNIIGNYIFSKIFSWILKFHLTDTLCGTKVFLKRNWKDIKDYEMRYIKNSVDQWGDFDLLFAATRLNLKMTEVPVRYKTRRRGHSKMRRFSHGFRLFVMSLIGTKRFRII